MQLLSFFVNSRQVLTAISLVLKTGRKALSAAREIYGNTRYAGYSVPSQPDLSNSNLPKLV